MSEATAFLVQEETTFNVLFFRAEDLTGEQIKDKGAISLNVQYKGQNHQLSLVVVNGSGPSLVECDWLRVVQLDLSYLKHIHTIP